MYFCVKPPHSHQEENKEENREEEDYVNYIIENITQEISSRLKILCQIICCIPLEKIFKNYNVPTDSCFIEKEKEFTTNGNASHLEDGHRTPKSKIRIMENSKTKSNIENKQPSTYKSIRHQLITPGESEKSDRCIETKSSSIELYSRIEKIRILKELQITDINRFIRGKADEKSIDTRDLAPPCKNKNQCIDTSDLPIDNKSTTGDVESMVTPIDNKTTADNTKHMETKESEKESKSTVTEKMAGDSPNYEDIENSVGDGPKVKIQIKPIKMGAFFKKLFKSRTNVKKNVNNLPINNNNDCENDCKKRDEEECFQDLIEVNGNNLERKADGISLRMNCTAMATMWRVRE